MHGIKLQSLHLRRINPKKPAWLEQLQLCTVPQYGECEQWLLKDLETGSAACGYVKTRKIDQDSRLRQASGSLLLKWIS
jgi:hypothetical protein